MQLRFSKMHGLGNDFMVVDGINQQVEISPRQIEQWADRHFGIGFDQLLLVEPGDDDQAMFRYRIFNADGGEVAQCGNGARCFARFVREQGLTDARLIPVQTRSGLLQLEVIDDERVRVNMGVPNFDPELIPFAAEQRSVSYSIDLAGTPIEISALSIGNPHAVILVDDVDQADVAGLGPMIESHPDFPERTNAGFMQVIDQHHFRLRVFERGAGETLACGSGACAAMVAGRMQGLLASSCRAELRGGELAIDWPGEGEPVMMTGGTATVYQGEITI